MGHRLSLNGTLWMRFSGLVAMTMMAKLAAWGQVGTVVVSAALPSQFASYTAHSFARLAGYVMQFTQQALAVCFGTTRFAAVAWLARNGFTISETTSSVMVQASR